MEVKKCDAETAYKGELVAKELIGMILQEAELFATGHGFSFRKSRVDGVAMIVTRDYRNDRINVDVLNNKVVEARIG